MRLYTTTIMMNSIMKTMGRSQHQRETARVNIAMNYKSVQWILFLVSLGKIIIVYQIFLLVDLDTVPFPMCSINVKISDKKWWRYFNAFFALHASATADLLSSIFLFPLGWFFSSISRTLRFLKDSGYPKGIKSNTNMDNHKNNWALHMIKDKGTTS